MNIFTIFNILCAIVFASATNTTDTKPIRRIKLEPAASTVDYYRNEVNKVLNYTLGKLTKPRYTTTDLGILRKFEEINKKIHRAQLITAGYNFTLFLPLWSFTLMDAEMAKVNRLYDNFVVFERENSFRVEKFRNAWVALAHELKDPKTGLINSIKEIQKYLAVNNETEYVYSLIQKEAKSKACSLKQSPYQILYNLYNTIALTELKAFVMLQFSYMVLIVNNLGDFKKEANLALTTHEKSTRSHVTELQKELSKTDRSIYVCDPQQYVENVTYTRLTRLLQGYIENERNMHYRGSCIRECRHFTNSKFTSCNKGFCNHQPKCEGRILRCTQEKPDMTLCVSKDPARRYDWVDYKDGPVMGNKGFCEKTNLFKLASWKRYIVECSYCLCLCDEVNSKSDRFFSLRDVTSDTEKNKVVTGVRIVKRNKIIHLQIQQGVLLPRGMINKDTLSWKPVHNYSINDLNVTNGVDYHIMDYRTRSLNLNELAGPVEHVVTGVRFQKNGARLSLGIRVTPIDFETGEVSPELRSFWLRNRKNPPNKAEIKLNAPDIPTRSGPHYLLSTPDQFIRFQPTSFRKDLAQTTVPFIDSQKTYTDGVPLSGIGLIYRGKNGSGGFIAPKLLTYEFGQHLRYD